MKREGSQGQNNTFVIALKLAQFTFLPLDIVAVSLKQSLGIDEIEAVVPRPAFAEYYRIALYPADSAGSKMFRDFYISGELRTEGHFQTIDTLDDCRIVFDGRSEEHTSELQSH